MRKTLILFFLFLQTMLGYGQKREFRGAWIQCVNGQFNGLTPDEMRSTLTKQLDALHADGVNAIIIRTMESFPHGCAGQSTQSLLGSTAMDDRAMP